jgi:hypothetical protein
VCVSFDVPTGFTGTIADVVPVESALESVSLCKLLLMIPTLCAYSI